MPIININFKKTSRDSYKIFVQKEAVNELPNHLKKLKIGEKYALITDSKTKNLFGNSLLRYLKKNKINADIISFTQGEKSKSLKTVEELAGKMVQKGFTRKDAIIALGGGVVGDIAGFLASSYMRGIPYIQIPTTLLAMVDSSIGGKTGVDLKQGKNLVGSFWQPKLVIIDTNYLKTLPEKHMKNGLAEVIKYGVIRDKSLFKFIEQELDKILALDEKALTKIIIRSVKNKEAIIEADEKEKGKRILLNYGHTYGHALEKLSNYTLLHGFAISIGMVIINKIGVKKGLLSKKDSDRIKNLLTLAGLPITSLKTPSKTDLRSDKKCHGNYINLVIPTRIGKAAIHKMKL